jgi:hypothetical protein
MFKKSMNQKMTKQKVLKQVHPVEPIVAGKKKYTLEDLMSIRFRSGDKNLSKNIDKILYGI